MCAISARKGGAHLPAALPGPRRQASGAKSAAPSGRRGPESVPLEPISPVRNALRPRRLPKAAALGSRPLRGPGTLGAAPRTLTTPSGPQARPPRPARSAPRARPRRSHGPSPRPERRLESPSVGEPPGPRGSGARRTSTPQGGGGAGRRASRPIPRRQRAEEERRTALQHRRGTFSARARAADRTVAGGCLPELPSVTPAGPSQPGTNTATAILPRPRPQAPPPYPALPPPEWPRPARLASWRHAPPPPPPRPAAVTSGARCFFGSGTFASNCALSPPALPRVATHSERAGRWGWRRSSRNPDPVSER